MQARDWREAQTDANGRPLYGIDMEIQAKLDAKRDPEKEGQVRAWMEELIGQPWPSDNIQDSLKDGVLLCKLVNAIQPGCVRTINTSKLAFKQMENINNFLTAAKTLGVRQVDLFTTIDLFEARNLPAVVTTLFCLGSAAQKLPGYTGPIIGVKFADKNERNFSEEQLAQAAAAPSRLAMGSYGLASQAGTRSISREVVKSSDAGSSSETSKLLQGSHGLASQSGSRSISREVVRSNSVGSSEMSRQTMGAYGGANQSGYRSGAHDVVRGTAEYRPAQAGQHHEAEPQYDQYEAPAEGLEQDNVLEDLEKLAVLRDKGIISEDEFQEKKRELLGL